MRKSKFYIALGRPGKKDAWLKIEGLQLYFVLSLNIWGFRTKPDLPEVDVPPEYDIYLRVGLVRRAQVRLLGSDLEKLMLDQIFLRIRASSQLFPAIAYCLLYINVLLPFLKILLLAAVELIRQRV